MGVVNFVGRVCLVSMFVFAGLNKLDDFNGSVAYAINIGNIPAQFAPVAIYAAIGVELFGSLAVIFNKREGALLLAIFCLTAGAVFHRFWEASGHEFVIEFIMFFKNVSIAGGLLVLYSTIDEGGKRKTD